ncbi:MAG: DUF1801 domain-containing protein [Flavihumibacter sp.]|nr:DUF1801 domain-containing protein [Flavihumibacter sp.]
MKAVDIYIDALPEEKAIIAQQLRKLLHSIVPGIEEKLSYKIPFYHYHGMFCFLNPVKDGIDIGFCRGIDLMEAFPQLEDRGRAIVASLVIRNKKDIQRLELPEIIAAAAAWNEEAKKKKISPLKSKKKKLVKK